MFLGLVVPCWVDGEFSEDFSSGGVDYVNVVVLNQDDDVGSGVGSPDSDVVHFAVDTQCDGSRRIDAVAPNPARSYFATQVATPHTTNNVRGLLRNLMDETGIENIAPHRLRRTAAAAVNEARGVRLASELWRHTDPRITMQHYIQRTRRRTPSLPSVSSRRSARSGDRQVAD